MRVAAIGLRAGSNLPKLFSRGDRAFQMHPRDFNAANPTIQHQRELVFCSASAQQSSIAAAAVHGNETASPASANNHRCAGFSAFFCHMQASKPLEEYKP